MKKLYALLFFISCIQVHLHALDASITYATFNSPVGQYIEVYLYMVGPTLKNEVAPDSSLRAKVEVVILFEQGENIVKFDKYMLDGPSSIYQLDFFDMKRYALANGEYNLRVSVKDMFDERNVASYSSPISVDYPDDALAQSDIQLINNFQKAEQQGPMTKSGYFLEPLPFNFYTKHCDRLVFYSEVYNADKHLTDPFMVRYAIDEIKSEGKSAPLMVGHKTVAPRPVNAILIQKDITKLPSGNYNLTVEVRNSAQELLSTKTISFQRSNPYLSIEITGIDDKQLEDEFVAQLDQDALRYSLKAISPIVTGPQVEMLNLAIGKAEDLETQRRVLFMFWAERNPNNPRAAYDEYMAIARAVDEKYNSGFGYGFETDRGYMYLKYGQPDDMISEKNDAMAPPYEIWTYYDFPATRQVNVKFIFYNPSLASNDYILLHSTARNERSNPNWEAELYRKAADEIDNGNVRDNFNRNASRFFNDF